MRLETRDLVLYGQCDQRLKPFADDIDVRQAILVWKDFPRRIETGARGGKLMLRTGWMQSAGRCLTGARQAGL